MQRRRARHSRPLDETLVKEFSTLGWYEGVHMSDCLDGIARVFVKLIYEDPYKNPAQFPIVTDEHIPPSCDELRPGQTCMMRRRVPMAGLARSLSRRGFVPCSVITNYRQRQLHNCYRTRFWFVRPEILTPSNRDEYRLLESPPSKEAVAQMMGALQALAVGTWHVMAIHDESYAAMRYRCRDQQE